MLHANGLALTLEAEATITTLKKNAASEQKELVVRVQPVEGNHNLRDRQSLKWPTRNESNAAGYSVPFSYEDAMLSKGAQNWSKANGDGLKEQKENKN